MVLFSRVFIALLLGTSLVGCASNSGFGPIAETPSSVIAQPRASQAVIPSSSSKIPSADEISAALRGERGRLEDGLARVTEHQAVMSEVMLALVEVASNPEFVAALRDTALRLEQITADLPRSIDQ